MLERARRVGLCTSAAKRPSLQRTRRNVAEDAGENSLLELCHRSRLVGGSSEAFHWMESRKVLETGQ
eukprot:scaffold1384_cov256-Pinguiococcus_pyrenoidosus.AAC.17